MKDVAAAVLTVLLVAGMANAQSDLRAGPYAIRGTVLAPNNTNTEVEIRLLSNAEMPLAWTRAHTHEPFWFRGLQGGTYYIEVEAPGMKPTRERVEFIGNEREVYVSLMAEPESQFAFRGPQDYSAETDTVDIKDLGRSPKVNKQFQDAMKKLQKGDVNGALARLESILADAPDFYDAHKILGIAYQHSHRYPEAEAQFRLARNLRPSSPAPLIYLGSLYLEQAGDGSNSNTPPLDLLEKAREVLLRAVELNSGAAFARYLLGVAYYRLGSYSDAEHTLLRALDLDSELGDIRLALANVYIRVQDWSKALVQLDTYLRDNPGAANRESILSTRTKVAGIANIVQKNQAASPGQK